MIAKFVIVVALTIGASVQGTGAVYNCEGGANADPSYTYTAKYFCTGVCYGCVCSDTPLNSTCYATCMDGWFNSLVGPDLCAAGIALNVPLNPLGQFNKCANNAQTGFNTTDTCNFVCNCCSDGFGAQLVFQNNVQKCLAECPTAFFPQLYADLCTLAQVAGFLPLSSIL